MMTAGAPPTVTRRVTAATTTPRSAPPPRQRPPPRRRGPTRTRRAGSAAGTARRRVASTTSGACSMRTAARTIPRRVRRLARGEGAPAGGRAPASCAGATVTAPTLGTAAPTMSRRAMSSRHRLLSPHARGGAIRANRLLGVAGATSFALGWVTVVTTFSSSVPTAGVRKGGHGRGRGQKTLVVLRTRLRRGREVVVVFRPPSRLRPREVCGLVGVLC